MHWLKHILMATDFSPQARPAEEYAARLAFAAQAELEILHVIAVLPGLEPYPLLNDMTVQQIREEVDRQLALTVRRAEERGITAMAGQRQGIPSEQIIEAAQISDVDLIVVGTQGRTGLDHVLVGSTAERVIKGATCPVLTVPSSMAPIDPRGSFKRILVPIDFSNCSLDALEYSAQVAKSSQAQVVIVHVLEWVSIALNFSPMEIAERNRIRDEIQAGLANYGDAFKRDGISADISLQGGPPIDAIIKHGQEQQCDLIIMGTHGRRGISRALFGSVAEGVLRRSRVPVLTVKSPKFAPGHRRVLAESIRETTSTPSG